MKVDLFLNGRNFPPQRPISDVNITGLPRTILWGEPLIIRQCNFAVRNFHCLQVTPQLLRLSPPALRSRPNTPRSQTSSWGQRSHSLWPWGSQQGSLVVSLWRSSPPLTLPSWRLVRSIWQGELTSTSIQTRSWSITLLRNPRTLVVFSVHLHEFSKTNNNMLFFFILACFVTWFFFNH